MDSFQELAQDLFSVQIIVLIFLQNKRPLIHFFAKIKVLGFGVNWRLKIRGEPLFQIHLNSPSSILILKHSENVVLFVDNPLPF